MICERCNLSNVLFNDCDTLCDDCVAEINIVEASYMTQPLMPWDISDEDYKKSFTPLVKGELNV